MRVGSTQPRRVDVRLVAATHRNLPALIENGQFREDLYFRLNGVTLHIPRLRDRPSEILPIAMLFVRQAAGKLKRPEPSIDDEAARALLQHAWPGNIRELRNVMERAVATCKNGALRAENLMLGPPTVPVSRPSFRTTDTPDAVPPPSVPRGMRGELQALERRRILEALASTGGNQTRAAALLQVSRRTLTNKLNAYAIDRPRKRVAHAGLIERDAGPPCSGPPPSTR
jgi:DNA-binding NtrC family response regulator